MKIYGLSWTHVIGAPEFKGTSENIVLSQYLELNSSIEEYN